MTPEIEALIKKIGTVTTEEARALAAAWNAWDAWDAWAAAWAAVRNDALDVALDAAWNDAWNDAWAAAWDAVLALMVRDLISGDQFDVLYGPWASVMEVEG